MLQEEKSEFDHLNSPNSIYRCWGRELGSQADQLVVPVFVAGMVGVVGAVGGGFQYWEKGGG